MAYENPIPSVEDGKDNLITTENNYEDSADDYVHKEDIYFAFIDVLGFKKTFEDIRIMSQIQESDSRNRIVDGFADKYKRVFNYYFKLVRATHFMNKDSGIKCYFGQTSDSLYFYTERVDILLEFIKVFGHFNLYAMMENVFFRGGIAKGNLYLKEDYQFYGNSVIYSYLLESFISKNPIIVIDENTYHDIANMEGTETFFKPYKDNRHYIDPFFMADCDIKSLIDERFWDEIKKIDMDIISCNINENMSMFEFDVKNYSKYVFLNEALNA